MNRLSVIKVGNLSEDFPTQKTFVEWTDNNADLIITVFCDHFRS